MRSTHARLTAQSSPSCGSRAASGAAAGAAAARASSDPAAAASCDSCDSDEAAAATAAAPKALPPGEGFCESKRTRPVPWPVPSSG